MMKIALVDEDRPFQDWLNGELANEGIVLGVCGPHLPEGNLVLWNLSRFPKPITQLVSHLHIQDPARGVMLLWDTEAPVEGLIEGLRGGAMEATSKQDRERILLAIRKHLAGRQVVDSEGALLQHLVDRSYALSMINEVLQAINHSEDVDSMVASISPSITEMTGALEIAFRMGEGAFQAIRTDPTEALLETIRHEQAFCWETHGDGYLAAFPILAGARWIGCLWLEGNSDRLSALVGISEFIQALCGQIAMAIVNFQHQAKTKDSATRDGLTQLFNRASFQLRLEEEFAKARRYGRSFSLVMLDLDHFKSINDSFGHPAGDQVLIEVGRLLQRSIRSSDLAARYGGEEFVILCQESSAQEARTVSERLREALHELRLTGDEGQALGRLSASFGIAQLELDDATSASLLQRADKALYRAKHEGRDRVCLAGALSGCLPASEPSFDPQALFVRGLAQVLEARDRYTGKHSAQMGKLARCVALHLELPGWQVEQVEHACLLHDLGKIAVPDAILHKPAPLSPEEWEIMRQHPATGAQMLRSAGLLELAEAIHHHHERWDGLGYPDHREGEQIPLVARVVAVLDAWGAMTEDRPYRQAPGIGYASTELRRFSGTQFDPRVVEALLAVLPAVPPDFAPMAGRQVLSL